MENLRLLLPLLRQLDVEIVTVSFDGCGDSGAIQDVCYDRGSERTQAINDHTVEQQTTSSVFDDGRWTRTVALETKTLGEAIEALTYDYLEETGVNWFDNDGGFGELRINVADGTVTMEVSVRISESDVAYRAARDIHMGEEVELR